MADYKQVLRQINGGTYAPIYVCYGSEAFFINRLIEQLMDKLIDPEHRALAVSKYDLMESPLDAMLDEAETLPFMVPHKLVIGTGAAFLTGAKDTGKAEHNLDRLTAYMQSPADFSVVVLTVNADKLDERKKLVKAMKAADLLVPCLPLSADELLKWVEAEAKRSGFHFAPGVAEQLILYSGTSMQQLSQEVEKCALFAGQGGELRAEALDQLVARSVEQNVFLLIEHIVQLKLEPAFTMLHELIRHKEEPIKIAALIARQFRIMLQVEELMQQGYSQQQAAGQLGLHPYAVKIAAGQAVRFDARRLGSILKQLADLDYEMKSGKVDKVLGLELFLLRLVS